MSNMVFKPHISKSFGDLFIVEGGYFGRNEDEFYDNFGKSGNIFVKLQSYQEEFVEELRKVLEQKRGSELCANFTLFDLGVSVQS